MAPASGTRDGAALIEDILRRRERSLMVMTMEGGSSECGGSVQVVLPLCDLPITTVNALLLRRTSSSPHDAMRAAR